MSECCTSKRKTPLINCVKFKHSFKQIQRVVVSGGDVTVLDESRKTALHWCHVYSEPGLVETGIQIISFLLDHGADINAKDQEGHTPLMLFVLRNSCQLLISTLLDGGADVTCKNVNCQTVLHMYSKFKYKSLDMCRRLIERFPDVNIRDKEGVAPLMCFLTDGCEREYIELLLDAGSDVKSTTNDANTVLHCYARWTFNNSFRYDDLAILRRLLNDGSLVNSMNLHFKTPLMAFILYMLPVKDVQFLLHRGADINACDNWGNSVLHMVSPLPNESYNKMIQTLLEYGANPDVSNRSGETPLLRALYARRDDTIKLLYNYGMSRTMGHTFIATYITPDNNNYRRAYQVVFKYMLLEGENVLDCYLNQEVEHYRELRLYVRNLIKELRGMKRRILVNGLSLFEFLAELDLRKSTYYLLNCSVYFKALEIEFPHYTDVVKSKVQFINLRIRTLQRVKRLSVSSRQESGLEGSEVDMNSDCFNHILGFVSYKDMKSLIIASLS